MSLEKVSKQNPVAPKPFLSHIKIPKPCLNDEQKKCVLCAIGAVAIIATSVTLAVLVSPLFFLGNIFLIAIMAATLSKAPIDLAKINYKDPEIFKEILRDLRNLTFQEIVIKYNFDELCNNGVIDEKTRDTCKDFLYRYRPLSQSCREATATVREKRRILNAKIQTLASQYFNAGKTDAIANIPVEVKHEQDALVQAELRAYRIGGEIVKLNNEFDAFRNAHQLS